MKTVKFGNSDLMVPVIGLGCMRMNNLEKNAIPYYIEHCCDLGINFFDHADVYSDGECESLFGEDYPVKVRNYPRRDVRFFIRAHHQIGRRNFE